MKVNACSSSSFLSLPLSLLVSCYIYRNFWKNSCTTFHLFVCCSFIIYIYIFFWQANHKELDDSVKLQRLQYLLFKALPVLRHVHQEQKSEVEIEAKIRGNII